MKFFCVEGKILVNTTEAEKTEYLLYYKSTHKMILQFKELNPK